MENVIYLDHAGTTRVDENVLKEMLPYLSYNYGNASSLYSIGKISRNAIEKSRMQVASAIGCNTDEIYFTSCGSESDNLGIKDMVSIS